MIFNRSKTDRGKVKEGGEFLLFYWLTRQSELLHILKAKRKEKKKMQISLLPSRRYTIAQKWISFFCLTSELYSSCLDSDFSSVPCARQFKGPDTTGFFSSLDYIQFQAHTK
jgi:hypothetical protein